MSDYSPFTGRHREPPMSVLIERLWLLQAPSGKVLSCATYLHPHGIEVRCGYSDEANLLISQAEKTRDEARARADEWKRTALEKRFSEL